VTRADSDADSDLDGLSVLGVPRPQATGPDATGSDAIGSVPPPGDGANGGDAGWRAWLVGTPWPVVPEGDLVAVVAARATRARWWWGDRDVVRTTPEALERLHTRLAGAAAPGLPEAPRLWFLEVSDQQALTPSITPSAAAPSGPGPAGAATPTGVRPPLTPRYDALVPTSSLDPAGEAASGSHRPRRPAGRRNALSAPAVVDLTALGTFGATAMTAVTLRGWPVVGSAVSGLALAMIVREVWATLLAWWRAGLVPTEDDLAAALLKDLRFDWRRLTRPLRWRRVEPVPGYLPVLVLRSSPTGAGPGFGTVDRLLRAHQRPYRLPGPWAVSLPWWLRVPVSAFRRPSVVVVTDAPRPDRAPPGLLSAWRRGARSRPRLLALWRRVVEGVAPPAPRRRAVRLLQVYLVVPLAAAYLSVVHSTSHPYCLVVRHAGEAQWGDWAGVQVCRGWSQLAIDTAEGLSHRLTRLTGSADPGRVDQESLFDPNRILAENRRVERLTVGSRPAYTVAVVTSLTASTRNRAIRSVVAQHEGLAGLYAAQRRINAVIGPNQPYLRLAIVNTADLTALTADDRIDRHLARAADGLVDLAHDRRYPLLAAVVTLDSKDYVIDGLLADVVRRLPGPAAVALVSPTMSADGLARTLHRSGDPVFFQIDSVNRQQVDLICRYTSGPRARADGLTAVFPAVIGGDRYVRSLRDDVESDPRCRADVRSWTPPSPADRPRPAPDVGAPEVDLAQLCPKREPGRAVFFGDRYTEVAEFTQHLRLACPDRMPTIYLSENSFRFLSDADLARQVPRGMPVVISGRRLLTCANLRHDADAALRGEGRRGGAALGQRVDFLTAVASSTHRCGSRPAAGDRWLTGGWAAGNYDTLTLINDAMRRTGWPPGPGPSMSARERLLRCLHGVETCRGSAYPSTSGLIRLGPDGVAERCTVLISIDDLALPERAAQLPRTSGSC
jgi:hypothetical protein